MRELRERALRAAPGRRPGLVRLCRPAAAGLAIYLVIHQHVPVERCRQLLSDVTGAEASAGFVHSCLKKASKLAAGTVALIRKLIAAPAVAGFDETTLRAEEKKYVHGAFTERILRVLARHHARRRDPPDFAGIAGTDRHVSYWNVRREHILGAPGVLRAPLA